MGDRTQLDNNFYNNARITGVSHILVVSGMHLGIVFSTFGALLVILGIRKRYVPVFLILSVFAVMAVCGFTPSIMRAGVTYFIIALGMLFYRRPDALNSLGLATVIILFINPFGVGNVSLLLSLFSTFGIIFLAPLFYNLMLKALIKGNINNKFLKGIAFLLSQTLSASFCTLPICAAYFGYISVISPVTNILVGYAMTAVLILSLLFVILIILPSVFNTAALLPVFFISVLIKYSIFVINFLADFKYAILALNIKYVFLLMTSIILFVFVYGFVKIKPKNKTVGKIALSLFSTVLIVFNVIVYTLMPKNSFSVLKVGNAFSLVLNYNNQVVVIGAGDGKSDSLTIKNHLLSLGKRQIDYLILPTLSKKSAGGAPALINNVAVKNIVYCNSGDFYKKIQYISDERFKTFNSKASITFENKGEISVYGDKGTIINLPDFSAVLYLSDLDMDFKINDKNLYLITDDLPNIKIRNLKYKNIIISANSDTVNNIKNKDEFFNAAIDTSQKHYKVLF